MSAPEHSLLDRFQPNYLQNVCKEITNSIYNLSKNEESLLRRKKAINLLQNWCSQTPVGHSEFNQESIRSLIKEITLEEKLPNSDLNLLQSTINNDSIFDELRLFQTKLMTTARKNYQNWKMIKERDDSELGEMFLPTDIPIENKFEKTPNSIEKLPFFDDITSSCKPDDDFRKHQLAAAYALLNLDMGERGILLLRTILNNFTCYDCLNVNEVDFIQYMYKNFSEANLPADLMGYILQHFPFIYEKTIINMCKNVIKGQREEIENFKSYIRKVSEENRGILYKINNILYELYSYSGYNSVFDPLLCFIREFV